MHREPSKRNIIIITTINLPNNLYDFKRLDRKGEWDYLVVGDLKTDHEAVREICREIGGIYLSPEDQEKLGFTHSAALGWNCIERKNIGYLFALKENYELIGSLDDDNFPTEDWFERVKLGHSEEDVYESNTGWLNVADWADVPYKLRGFPVHLFHQKPEIRVHESHVNIGIQSGLVLGDPDTDALTRIVNRPTVSRYSRSNFCLAEETMCPYNTQNTVLVRELVSANMMWAACGRYDDIFASYVGQKIAWKHGYHVRYGDPLATQRRNDHNLVRDLKDEILGMEIQETFLQAIADVKLKGHSPVEDLVDIVYFLLERIPLLPRSLKTLVDTWFYDVNKILD
ncbi:MAG: hypothetical protein JRN15_01705 [Nitrososphaerota archaeon]|nr:hypothetical protein [Nitrososphaerota archaeon]